MSSQKRGQILQARRCAIKKNLAAFQSFLSNYTSRDYLQLNVRFQRLNSSFQNFDDFHDELDALDNSQDSVNERFTILESYYQAMSEAQKYLSDGSSEEFEETQLEQKVFAVKSRSLNSPAPSSESFVSGLELLQPGENKHALVSKEISWFLNLPREEENDYETIDSFASELQRHVESLSCLGVIVPQEFVVVLVQERFLNKANREKWENSMLLQDDFPTLAQLFKFLAKVASVSRQEHEEKYRWEASSARVSSGTPERRMSRRDEEESRREATASIHTSRTKILERPTFRSMRKCWACSQDCQHLTRCNTFIKLSVRQRLNLINQLRVCKICLNKHSHEVCLSTLRCRICDRKHHTWVHIA